MRALRRKGGGEMHNIHDAVPGLIEGIFTTGLIAGSFTLALGVLCLVFNRKLGGWFRRFSLAVFGTKEKEPPDEIIFRGLVCVLGLLYSGMGLMLIAPAFK